MNLLKKYISDLVDISEKELNDFCSFFTLKIIDKKDFLLKQGDDCWFEGFVNKGCFRLIYLDPKGKYNTLYFANTGMWVVDLDSFMNRIPSQFSIQALEASEVLLINRENKQEAFEQIPVIEKLFRLMSQKSLIMFKDSIMNSISLTAEERYEDFLSKYPDIAKNLSNIEIASYLGISPEFLSKIRGKKR